MLREIAGLRQDEPGLQRRWFHDDYFDLFVWQNAAGAVTAFELCYGQDASECALVWQDDTGFFHDGDASGPHAAPESDPIATRFRAAAHDLPEPIRAVLDARIAEYAQVRDHLLTRRRHFRRADWQQRRRETR
jgi:hypothetical protein